MLFLVALKVWFLTSLASCELSCDSDKVTCSEDNLVTIYHEVNGMKQDDPALIEFVKTNVLIPPNDKPLNLISTSGRRLEGQFGQVPVAEEILGLKPKNKKQKPGFFIEAGAACGEFLSNSLYFELIYGWTGLLVEPNPDLLEKLLKKHRKAWILPHCLSTKPEVETVSFDASMYNSGIYLEGKPLPSRLGGGKIPISPLPYERKIQVQCFPLYTVLKALGNPLVDYFTLDIEGAEFVVLDTIPWDDVKMTLIDVEINHAGEIFPGDRDAIKSLLESKGYFYSKTAKIDDFFYKPGNNRFIKKTKKKVKNEL